jgi:hypothetical protein
MLATQQGQSSRPIGTPRVKQDIVLDDKKATDAAR